MIDGLHDDLICQDIELLLSLPLDVLQIGGSQYVGQSGAPHLVGDHLRSKRKFVEHA